MEFLVIAENKPYYQWQIELLIESFKLLKLQEHLYVFLIGENEKKFSKNIDQHKNCFYLKDKSLKYGFNYFNFFESIIWFKEIFHDKDFSIIDSDCLFVKDNFSSLKDKNIVYQTEVVKNDSIETILNNLFNFRIYQICSFLYFSKNISSNFFKKSLNFTESLIVEIIRRNLNQNFINNHIFKYGLILNSVYEKINVNTTYNIINFPQSNILKYNFLSYKHDIKPFFKKNDFEFVKDSFTMKKHIDPFVALTELPDFPNCLPVKQIAKSYLGINDEI